MKKLLITTALCFSLSGAAFAGDLVKPTSKVNFEGFTNWIEVLNKQEIKTSNERASLGHLFLILDQTKHIKYCADSKGEDNWQTPEETLKRGCGDCEDFAILWYYMARAMGFSDDQLNILMGYLPKQNNEHHAILAIDLEGFEFVLDPYNQGGDLKRGNEYNSNNFTLSYRINSVGWGVN